MIPSVEGFSYCTLAASVVSQGLNKISIPLDVWTFDYMLFDLSRRLFFASAAGWPGGTHKIAQSRTAPRVNPLEDGFASMFDGRSLKGWSIREGPETSFYVRDGAIVVHEGAGFPAWLRYDRQYENFDFRCDFYVKNWTNSGIYFHAPEHGRNMWVGKMINIFQKEDLKPLPESHGSIFPLLAPLKVNVRSNSEWNTMRIAMDWPRLRVWMNGDLAQDRDCEQEPELRYRLRRGYIGIESLSYPIRFRNLRVRELPPAAAALGSSSAWEGLYESERDLAKWQEAWQIGGRAQWQPIGGVLRSHGVGYLATKEQYKDFELQVYIRASRHSNGGIFFRSDLELTPRHYEIQIHDVEGAVYPTGSLYFFKRSMYPRIEPEKWYLLQAFVKGSRIVVRVNGENVTEYNDMDNLAAGHILLQSHDAEHWLEYKQFRIRRL